MRKIGEIHFGNANVWQAIMIGVISTCLFTWASLIFIDLDIISYLQKDKLMEVLLILPTMFVVFVIHELIHVGLFIWFGKGNAKIKIRREKSIKAVVIHQTNENVFYNRREKLIILLAPLLLLTTLLILLSLVAPMPFLLATNIALNALRSTTDLYVAFLLLSKYHSKVKINFHPSKMILNVYESIQSNHIQEKTA